MHVVTAAPGEYSIDGVRMPELHMVRGSTYVFDQGADSNVGHPLRIRTAARAPYTDGVVGSGTPGLRGAKTVFTVPQEAPDGLQYYCTEHPSGAGMGGGIVIGGGLYEALRASGAARIELGGVRRIQAAPQLGAQLVYRDSQLNPRSDWSNQDLALWSEGAPDWLKCPLTFEIMRMPVVAQDGFSYELALMKEWAGQTEESTMTSPMTNLPMSLVVYENKSLYHATEQWVAARIQARLHLQRLSVLQVQIAGLLDTLKGKEITIEGLEAASMKEGIHFVVEGLWRMWRALERSRTDDAMVSQIVRRLQGLRGTKEELLALFILQKYRRLVSILEAEVPQALAELGFKLPEARTTGQTAWVAEIEGQAFLGNGYDLSCQGKRWMDPTGECEPWDRRNKGWHADYRWAVTIYKHKQKRALPSLKPLPASDTRRGV